ncbi:MAG: DUF4199 domain-containing protein [Bacteroidia bacterium]
MSFFKEHGIRLGFISAAFAIVLQLVLFSLGAEKYLSGWTSVSFFMMLTLAFVAGALELRSNGGTSITFQRSLMVVFTVMVITEFFAVITEFSVYNVIDPDFYIEAKEIRIAQTIESFESFSNVIDYNDSDLDEIMEEVEKADFQFYVSNAALKFVMWLCIDFLFALILAAIIKKDPPVSERTN